MLALQISNSQLESLVEFSRPAVVLGFCGELALLVSQEWTDHGDVDERPKHPRRLPLHVVHRDDWRGDEREGEQIKDKRDKHKAVGVMLLHARM